MDLFDFKIFLEKLDKNKIIFDRHFYRRSRERPVDESMVRSFLNNLNKLSKIEEGKKGRFKLWFKMSGKYFLVLIVEVFNRKSLKVVSAWNSNRKWQKKLLR